VERQKIGITGQQEVGSSGKGELEKLVVPRIATELDTLADRHKLDDACQLGQERRALGW
jgi:hypothetical protein